MPAAAAPLRLLAQDAADLTVIAAALPDAVLKVGDIRWEAKTRTLTLALNRFRWEAGKDRVRSALQLGGVLGVRARGVPRRRSEVMSLLTLTFEPGEAPGGLVVLVFSGGPELRAEVECLDAVVADVSDPWPTRRAPTHADAEEAR